MTRWKITERESFQGGFAETVRVFEVAPAKAKDSLDLFNRTATVWWNGTTANCCNCSSLQSAMLSTCKHAMAVKRLMKK